MAKKVSTDRFVRVYTQGGMNISEIWVDRETGVNYHYHCAGNSGGMAVLVDKDGKPIITPINEEGGFFSND